MKFLLLLLLFFTYVPAKVSPPTNHFTSLYFKKKIEVPQDVILWDDGSPILWDDGSYMEWG